MSKPTAGGLLALFYAWTHDVDDVEAAGVVRKIHTACVHHFAEFPAALHGAAGGDEGRGSPPAAPAPSPVHGYGFVRLDASAQQPPGAESAQRDPSAA